MPSDGNSQTMSLPGPDTLLSEFTKASESWPTMAMLVKIVDNLDNSVRYRSSYFISGSYPVLCTSDTLQYM